MQIDFRWQGGDNPVMNDPSEEIQRAATAHRNRIRKEAQEKAHEKASAADGSPGILLHSLSDRNGVGFWLSHFALVIGCIALGGLPFVLFPGLSELVWNNMVLAIVWSLAVLFLIVVAGVSRDRIIARYRLMQLRRIKYGFNLKRYLTLLSQARRGATHLEISIEFDEPWDKTTSQNVLDAVHEWVPDIEKNEWKSDKELLLTSKILPTTYEAESGEFVGFGEFFTNRKIDECFDGVVRHVFPRLNATNKMTLIEVDIIGNIVSPHEKP